MSLPRILIVGGSTRAAADSVRRAGWQPICADLFADLDLRQSAEIIPVRNYPQSLPEDVSLVRADGWFYCGALENHPEIIERMLGQPANYGQLFGTLPEALKLVRNPKWLATLLGSISLPALEVRSESTPPTPDGSWLQKPLAGAGGRSIRVWDQHAASNPLREPHYFQRRVSGIGLSAIFRITDNGIEWLGASREREASPASSTPSNFSYSGSIGPLIQIPINARAVTLTNGIGDDSKNSDGPEALYAIQQKLTLFAATLPKWAPGLRGLVGLDFRFDGKDVWLTEVNPRYTASVEVLELATGQSLLNPAVSRVDSKRESRPGIVAKQILYAKDSLKVPDLRRFLPGGDPWQIPIIADIPTPNSIVEPGWPICTVMASGETEEIVESILSHRVDRILDVLAGTDS